MPGVRLIGVSPYLENEKDIKELAERTLKWRRKMFNFVATLVLFSIVFRFLLVLILNRPLAVIIANLILYRRKQRTSISIAVLIYVVISFIYTGIIANISFFYASQPDVNYPWVYAFCGFIILYLGLGSVPLARQKSDYFIFWSQTSGATGNQLAEEGFSIGVLIGLIVYPILYNWPQSLKFIPGTIIFSTWLINLVNWLTNYWIAQIVLGLLILLLIFDAGGMILFHREIFLISAWSGIERFFEKNRHKLGRKTGEDKMELFVHPKLPFPLALPERCEIVSAYQTSRGDYHLSFIREYPRFFFNIVYGPCFRIGIPPIGWSRLDDKELGDGNKFFVAKSWPIPLESIIIGLATGFIVFLITGIVVWLISGPILMAMKIGIGSGLLLTILVAIINPTIKYVILYEGTEYVFTARLKYQDDLKTCLQPALAVVVAKTELKVAEKNVGSDHPDVAKSLNNLGALYHTQGQYEQAEPLYKRVLAINEKLGLDHPDVEKILNNLAVLYHAQGKYAQAESFFNRSLAISEKTCGPDHLTVATSLKNLGDLYRTQGKYAQAEPLFERALAISEKTLGPNHPDVEKILNNLAVLYHAQGKYEQAEPLYKRSLAIMEKTLSPDHPAVATSLENLAVLYRATNRESEAEKLEARAARISAPSSDERQG
jgi:tetratricopeptide (TPR) repeat protein